MLFFPSSLLKVRCGKYNIKSSKVTHLKCIWNDVPGSFSPFSLISHIWIMNKCCYMASHYLMLAFTLGGTGNELFHWRRHHHETSERYKVAHSNLSRTRFVNLTMRYLSCCHHKRCHRKSIQPAAWWLNSRMKKRRWFVPRCRCHKDKIHGSSCVSALRKLIRSARLVVQSFEGLWKSHLSHITAPLRACRKVKND